MNICMCGAQNGYPHDKLCSFPLFNGSDKRQAEWWQAYVSKRTAEYFERGYCLRHGQTIGICIRERGERCGRFYARYANLKEGQKRVEQLAGLPMFSEAR